MTDKKPAWLDSVGAFVAVSVTALVAFQTIAPYFLTIPQEAEAIIGQQQTMLQTVFIAVVSFFFGASLGGRQKDRAIGTLVDNARAAAFGPEDDDDGVSIDLAPGQQATVKADE